MMSNQHNLSSLTKKMGLPYFEIYDFYRNNHKYSQLLSGNKSLKSFHEYKCIFFHIPKTGGMAVAEGIFNGKIIGDHRGVEIYKRLFKKKFYSYFKFSFVRNPWSRLLSAYNFLIDGGLHESDQKWAEQNIMKFKNFEDFVLNWVNPKNVQLGIHFIPQYQFIIDIYGKQSVDYIGKQESLNEDFKKICSILEISNANLNYINTGKKIDDYRVFYTKKTQDIVRKVYKKDIKLFNYIF